MGDFFFVFKTLIATVVLVFFMQIRIGPTTIENHTHAWLQNSFLVGNLRYVAGGAIKAVTEGYQFVSSTVDKNVGAPSTESEVKPAPRENRAQRLRLHRSESYHRDQEREGPTGEEID